MQGQEYLNQISASNRPVKKSRFSSIMTSKWFIGGAVFVVLLVIIMIIGSVMSGNKGGEKYDCYRLYLHLSNTVSVIEEYQDAVKSSDLRANSSSLAGILTNTNRDLTDYMTAKYAFKDKDIDKDMVEEATLEKDGLMSELFEAKINGNLDRIYAHKMAYEISMIAAEENKLAKEAKDEALTSLIETSYNSLDSLYSKFNEFSETK